ncbi:hypothetical protein JOC85_003461 [Bacillus mesophilus]|uniref:Uncharacterized protein n=1 Tax=Bacillus mesophilus TaxID=1808955 RepID=A0A6M0QA82_9BACI|nr:hypothetical protein [Bacillus mesophilus]MBM7662651.1 hypothetical protein [Bacillus mesophilus]NEY73284.1 hypothetical protein [Bacillus mesophilus]
MNYELIFTLGALLFSFGLMTLIWSHLKEKDEKNAGTYLPFFPGLFTLGGIIMVLVGFLSPFLLGAH